MATVDAERAARAELAVRRMRGELLELAGAGVQLDAGQLAELHRLVDLLGGRPAPIRFGA